MNLSQGSETSALDWFVEESSEDVKNAGSEKNSSKYVLSERRSRPSRIAGKYWILITEKELIFVDGIACRKLSEFQGSAPRIILKELP